MEFDKVKEIIAEQLSVSEDDITMETTFEELDADSLDIFQIISEIEEQFNIEFDNEAAETIKTVADAVDHIKNAEKK